VFAVKEGQEVSSRRGVRVGIPARAGEDFSNNYASNTASGLVTSTLDSNSGRIVR
jgi:hypothetical protein